jgi:hypothetical protein
MKTIDADIRQTVNRCRFNQNKKTMGELRRFSASSLFNRETAYSAGVWIVDQTVYVRFGRPGHVTRDSEDATQSRW